MKPWTKLPTNEFDENLEVTFLPMKALEEGTGKYDSSITREYSDVKKGFTPFVDGDLIFAKITPCMENGKIAVLSSLKNGIGFGSTEFHVSRSTEFTNVFYLFYYFLQRSVREDAKRNFTGSAGQLRVSKNYFESISIPLPPLAEQHRIVVKIEELFSDLDAGIASLKQAQVQLKTYRQTVLKYAFEGKLTATWRAQGKPEPAEKLLAQIKAEREKQYQQQLAAWQKVSAEGNGKKKLPKPQKPKEFPPLTEAELAELPELPERWCWVKVVDIGGVETGTTPSKKEPKYYEDEYPFYKPTDLNAGNNVRLADDHLSALGLKMARFLPENSILVTCIGATIGKTGIIRKSGASNQQINAIIPYNFVVPEFIYYQIIESSFQRRIISNSSSTTLPILNKAKFEILPFALPSLTEQHQIVQEIESRLSVCDKLEESLKESLQKAEALRQSILKKAFAGKLVPQDPNDEPAEKLLERIQVEKDRTQIPRAHVSS